MKTIFIVLSFAFLFPAMPVFGEDRVVQSVGIVIDRKSPNHNVERILKKVILSVSVSNRNIRLFSSDSADIEYTGIQSLNGTVLIRTVRKTGVYQVELYQIDKQTNRFDDSARIALKDFGDRVDDIALQIISNIGARFSPKPLRELTKIDLVKVKLSEYESQDGFWTLSVIPAYNLSMAYTSLRSSNFNGGDSREKTMRNNGGSVSVEGIYRLQQWNFSAFAGTGMGGWNETNFHASYNEFRVSGMAAYGFFGSVIVLGVEPTFSFFRYTTDYTNYHIQDMGGGTNTTNVLVAPNVTMRNLSLNIYLQVNISKDYYISFSAGLPFYGDFFYGLNLDFSKNGLFPAYQSVNVPTDMIDSGGPPFIRVTLNFRLFPPLWLRVCYENQTVSFYKSKNNKEIDLPVATGMDMRLDSFRMSMTRIGLGINYEF